MDERLNELVDVVQEQAAMPINDGTKLRNKVEFDRYLLFCGASGADPKNGRSVVAYFKVLSMKRTDCIHDDLVDFHRSIIPSSLGTCCSRLKKYVSYPSVNWSKELKAGFQVVEEWVKQERAINWKDVIVWLAFTKEDHKRIMKLPRRTPFEKNLILCHIKARYGLLRAFENYSIGHLDCEKIKKPEWNECGCGFGYRIYFVRSKQRNEKKKADKTRALEILAMDRQLKKSFLIPPNDDPQLDEARFLDDYLAETRQFRPTTGANDFLQKQGIKGRKTFNRNNYGIGSYKKYPKVLAEKIGKDVKKYKSDADRKGGATILLEDGVDPEIVREAGDWKDIKTVQSSYRRTTDHARMKVASSIGGVNSTKVRPPPQPVPQQRQMMQGVQMMPQMMQQQPQMMMMNPQMMMMNPQMMFQPQMMQQQPQLNQMNPQMMIPHLVTQMLQQQRQQHKMMMEMMKMNKRKRDNEEFDDEEEDRVRKRRKTD